MSKERPKVRAVETMDNETFLKHMNARHTVNGTTRSAAGISKYGKSNVPGDEDEHLLRKMHEVFHSGGQSGREYITDHDHGSAK